MRVLKRIALVLGATALALVVLEVAVRVAGVAPPPDPEKEGQQTLPVGDPVLRFVLNPDAVRRLVFENGEVIAHTHNGLGLRGPKTTYDKPPGVFRIACLGDSYTYGSGVRDDETWPVALGRLLGDGHEVLNFGVPGYETVQEVRLLETRALRFDPDLVLLCWFFNDTGVAGSGAAAGGPQPSSFLRWLQDERDPLLRFLRDTSHLANVVLGRARRTLHREHYVAGRLHMYEPDNIGWRGATDALRSARDMLAERGIPFAVVLYPYMRREDGKLISHDAYVQVAEFLDAEGIAYVDLGPVFDAVDVAAHRAHNDHPNGRGHAMAADAVARFLRQSGMLGS